MSSIWGGRKQLFTILDIQALQSSMQEYNVI